MSRYVRTNIFSIVIKIVSVLFADDFGLVSGRVAKVQELFDRMEKQIHEDHGLRVVSLSHWKSISLQFIQIENNT